MSRKGQLENYTYFPVSSNTSKNIINTLKNAGIDIENRPLAMQADKARQSQIAEKPIHKNGYIIRYHAMSAEKILEVVENLDEVTAIIHQRNRTTTKVIDGEKQIVDLPDNFAVFVKLEDGKEYVAIIEFDAEIKREYILQDGKGEQYHTTVTVFEPDVERDGEPFDYIEYLLLRGDNQELEIIKENSNSEAAIRQTEATASKKEFSNSSIPQTPEKSTPSTKKDGEANLPEGARAAININPLFTNSTQSGTIKKNTKRRKQVEYIPKNTLGGNVIVSIRTQLNSIYSGVKNGVATEIAIEHGDSLYIVDSGKENGDITFQVREILRISNDDIRVEYKRRLNNESIRKGNTTNGLSSQLGYIIPNNGQSNLRRKLRAKLPSNTGKSKYYKKGISQKNGNRGEINYASFEEVEDRKKDNSTERLA